MQQNYRLLLWLIVCGNRRRLTEAVLIVSAYNHNVLVEESCKTNQTSRLHPKATHILIASTKLASDFNMRFYFKLEVTEGNVRLREYFSADFSPFYYNNVIFPKFGSDLFLKFRDSKPQNPEDSWRPESKDICRISSVLSA